MINQTNRTFVRNIFYALLSSIFLQALFLFLAYLSDKETVSFGGIFFTMFLFNIVTAFLPTFLSTLILYFIINSISKGTNFLKVFIVLILTIAFCFIVVPLFIQTLSENGF